MAVVTNTFRTTSAVGNRETLSDVVSRITPEDTPIYSLIEKESFKGTHPEWETDDLAAPADNVQVEGDDYTFSETTPAVRVGNYTQILRKDGIISGTQDATDNAGSVEQVKYQKLIFHRRGQRFGCWHHPEIGFAVHLDHFQRLAGRWRLQRRL